MATGNMDENLKVGFEICKRTDRQTDRQTDIRAYYNRTRTGDEVMYPERKQTKQSSVNLAYKYRRCTGTDAMREICPNTTGPPLAAP